jgi:hypothetical protein
MRWPVLGLVLITTGCSSERPPAMPAWPEPSEVERVTAVVSGSVSNQPDLAEFEVPSEFVPELLQVLSPPEYHKHPDKYTQEVGRLRVVCRDGRVAEVGLVFYGKAPVLFTLDGVSCMRGGPYKDLAPGHDKYLPEVLTLEGFLRAAQRGDRTVARECLDLLHRSAGRSAKEAAPGTSTTTDDLS